MEIYQVRQLIAISDTGSFTRAADLLNVTQPSLSTGISKLEQELGVTLVIRGRRSVKLSEQGKMFVARAQQILDLCAKIRLETKEHDTQQVVRFGVIPSVPVNKISAIARVCMSAFPNVSFDYREGSSQELHRLVDGGRIDIALTSSLQPSEADDLVHLLDEDFVLICQHKHPLANRRFVSLKDLNGLPFVLRMSCEARNSIAELMNEKSVTMKVVARTAQDERALHMVQEGIGIAFVPAMFASSNVLSLKIQDMQIKRTLILRKKLTPAQHVTDVFDFLRNKDIRNL